MTLLWLVAGAALAMALVAWRQARAASRRAEQLSQLYWELKYQQGELRVRLQSVNGEDPPPARGAEPGPADGFIPLSSLKR